MGGPGLPAGVVNYVCGVGGEVGAALIEDARVAGATFTGSYEVGMQIVRRFAQGAWPRPCIAEMGGMNAAIVSRHADLERAATGIVRSAFGLQGQKCSAGSRAFIERPVYQPLVERLVAITQKLQVGDCTRREVWMGPVVNQASYRDFQTFCEEISQAGGKFLTGGKVLQDGERASCRRGDLRLGRGSPALRSVVRRHRRAHGGRCVVGRDHRG